MRADNKRVEDLVGQLGDKIKDDGILPETAEYSSVPNAQHVLPCENTNDNYEHEDKQRPTKLINCVVWTQTNLKRAARGPSG